MSGLPLPHRLARWWSLHGLRRGRWRAWEVACARAGRGKEILATLDHGARVRVDLGDPMCRFPLTYGGMYERSLTAALVEALRPGDTFLDVGANFGYYSLLACGRVGPGGQVVAFEPNPRVAATLRANLALNDCAQAQVVEAAVGRVTGRQALFVPRRGQSGRGTLSPEEARRGGVRREIPVAVTSLDEFVAATPREAIRAVKVEAEGFELEIVTGAQELLRRYQPLLCCEVGPDTGEQVGDFLREIGYTVARLAPGGKMVPGVPGEAWGSETLCGRPRKVRN